MAMFEKAKKRRKGSVSEEDISILLEKYTATTVLTLLQEVALAPDVKIDWNALVKRTATGISSARECQMLWRHLAYRDALLERLDDGAQPLDDDSDLEYELEPFPSVSSGASTEATACVKVLIASCLPSDPSVPNSSTIEVPLTINIPSCQSSRAASDNSLVASVLQGTNITIPVSVQKQQLPAVMSVEGLDANGSGSLPARRKRKPWSAAEDLALAAAVEKYSEKNWAVILKEGLLRDRTAPQLSHVSQRWSIIKKHKGNLNVGSSSQLSEAQLATRRAVSLALNMPAMDNLKATSSLNNAGTNSNITVNNSTPSNAAEALSVGIQSQSQSPQAGTPGSSSKPRAPSKKPSAMSALSPDAMVKAAAVAAGARIATPSDAASLLKAAQSKNAVHIMPGGCPLIKSSVAGNSNPLPSTHLGGHPNVHYIRTGLTTMPLSTYSSVTPNASRPGGSQQVEILSVKPTSQTVWPSPARTTPESNALSEATDTATFPATNHEVKTTENIANSSAGDVSKELLQDRANSSSGVAPKELIQDHANSDCIEALKELIQDHTAGTDKAPRLQVKENLAACSDNAPEQQLQEDQASVSGNCLEENNLVDWVCVSGDNPNKQIQEDHTALPNSQAILKGKRVYGTNSKCSSSPEPAGIDQMAVTGEQVAPQTEISIGTNMTGLPIEDRDDYLPAVEKISKIQSTNGKVDKVDELGGKDSDGSEEEKVFLCRANTATEMENEERIVTDVE